MSSVQYNSLFPYLEKIFHQKARSELIKYPGLSFCAIQCGMFMDYYGMPYTESYLFPVAFMVDVFSAVAGLPGDGNSKIAFTCSKDVARYVVALLDVPGENWPQDVICFGEKLTGNELVRLAEDIRGRQLPTPIFYQICHSYYNFGSYALLYHFG